VLLVALLIAAFHGGRLPGWRGLVLTHVAVACGIHLLLHVHRRWRHWFVRMLRSFYPMILYSFFYLETHRLDGLFSRGCFDLTFIRADEALFGCQPSLRMVHWLPQWWVSELLYAAYFSYYLMVFGTGLALYFLRDSRRYFRYLTTVTFIFYVCYLTYAFFPVMGPHGGFERKSASGVDASTYVRAAPDSTTRGPFYHIMFVVYEVCEPEGGAAFPSSHVAVAAATLCFTWREFRRLRWLHLAAVVLLCVSTVYCGYHYAVDVIGGLLLAAVLIPVGLLLYKWTDGHVEAVPSS
jgi:membrane-associated phospholipid phosphatase